MQSEFLANWSRPRSPGPDFLLIGDQQVPFNLVRNPRARRYILRVLPNGFVRITIPRAGSLVFAFEFARRNSAWIGQQLQKRRAEVHQPRVWVDGTGILFRGELSTLRVRDSLGIKLVEFADQTIALAASAQDLRIFVQNHLWSLAEKELLPRTHQMAAHHRLSVRHVVVRNQRSRWGSCSPARTISLNWRLIQAPPTVRDYLITHELMHLLEMNHSRRFWRLVEHACPAFADAEAWLDAHAYLLRSG